MTTIHHSPPPNATPFSIYEDPRDTDTDLEAPSVSDVYDGDTSFDSSISLPGPDEAIASIESENENIEYDEDTEPEPYKPIYTSRTPSSNRRVSAFTTTSLISSLPSELSISSKPHPPTGSINASSEPRYTPKKERHLFRNPSSVRAMQMASPPPFTAFEAQRERVKGQYKLATPSRSGRSGSVSGSQRSSHISKMQSPRPMPTPTTAPAHSQQHYPLVLLHVTLLPLQVPYSANVMARVMPSWLLKRFKLLEEKVLDVVLMQRGILIPHPREEYELLEERLLETLELKTPRLLKCGHFVPPGTDVEDHEAECGSDRESRASSNDRTGRGSRMSGGTITADDDGEWKDTAQEDDDACLCTDCNRPIKKPGRNKRWDIKIYAANGLMRAGAWAAAWSEMERVDVEITPSVPEDIRRALERAKEEEHEVELAKQRAIAQEEEETRIAEEEARRQVEAQMRSDAEAAEKRRLEEQIRLEAEAAAASAERLRLQVQLEREASRSIPQPSMSFEHPHRSHSRHVSRSSSSPAHQRIDDIPLTTLLRNYLYLLARDQRHIAIAVLSIIVLLLALNTNLNNTATSFQSIPPLPPIVQEDQQQSVVMRNSASMIIYTTTATSTTIVTMLETNQATMAASRIPSVTPGSSPAEVSLAASQPSTPSRLINDPSTEVSPLNALTRQVEPRGSETLEPSEPNQVPSAGISQATGHGKGPGVRWSDHDFDSWLPEKVIAQPRSVASDLDDQAASAAHQSGGSASTSSPLAWPTEEELPESDSVERQVPEQGHDSWSQKVVTLNPEDPPRL